MSSQDNFGSGFLLGTLFGGIVGGTVGAIVASQVRKQSAEGKAYLEGLQDSEGNPLPPSDEEMEMARRGLEEKIAQLNTAIDDVRHRLGSPNGQNQPSEDIN